MSAAQPMSLARLLGDAAAPDVPLNGLSLDSRSLQPGELFLATAGTRAHGLAHVQDALARGASAVLWEPVHGLPAPQLPVPALAIEHLGERVSHLAARFYGEPGRSLQVLGVTGTDGKTSTAWLAAQALDALQLPCAYLGTLGYGRVGALDEASHTTPDPVRVQALLARQHAAGCKALAMEVSSHALAQHRVAAVPFTAVALTNVGRDHLDYHGTEQAYADAKRRLFFEADAARVVLNRDDRCGARWLSEVMAMRDGHEVTAYGIGGATPVRGNWLIAEDVVLHSAGVRFRVRSPQGGARIDSQLMGRFNVYNLLAALGLVLACGIPLVDACEALSAAPTVPGRAEAFRGPASPAPVVVDYAHTPQALAQILRALRPHTSRRLICVFGCGGDRDRGKRPLMGSAAAELADRVIVTDDNPRSEQPAEIVAEILTGIGPDAHARVTVEHDRARAIASAIAEAGEGDLVVVAGKGHEDYQLIGAERRAFSDRDCVARLLRAGTRQTAESR